MNVQAAMEVRRRAEEQASAWLAALNAESTVIANGEVADGIGIGRNPGNVSRLAAMGRAGWYQQAHPAQILGIVLAWLLLVGLRAM